MTSAFSVWYGNCSGLDRKALQRDLFELLGMDLIGKLTLNGNQYICASIDYLTKWPQAYPLKSKSAEEVSHCILKFFYQFEPPKHILTDQGKKSVNQVCKRLLKCQMPPFTVLVILV